MTSILKQKLKESWDWELPGDAFIKVEDLMDLFGKFL